MATATIGIDWNALRSTLVFEEVEEDFDEWAELRNAKEEAKADTCDKKAKLTVADYITRRGEEEFLKATEMENRKLLNRGGY